MNAKRTILIGLLAMYFPCSGQNLLTAIIHKSPVYTKYQYVFEHPTKYHLQVIYTQVNRDKNNHVVLKKYSLEPPTRNYYYPASLVKLPLTALALQKINELKIKNLSRDTRLCVDSSHACETHEYTDTTAISGYPSIAQYIKRMLLVSDNAAYSRIYEFLSPSYINTHLHRMGYANATINQRFTSGCDSTDNRYTNEFIFLDKDSNAIYKQLSEFDSNNLQNHALNTAIGKAFKYGDKLLPPKNFRHNNYIPFEDENNVLLSIIYPHAVKPSQRFKLTDDDYSFLKKYMCMLPKESTYPTYNTTEYPDNFKKYIYFGTTGNIEDTTIRSYNIVGRAYGFLADCAYVKDSKTGVEFFLSVVMYVNKNNILNTDDYQYDTIGLPFMSDLGHTIYNYELNRKKKF